MQETKLLNFSESLIPLLAIIVRKTIIINDQNEMFIPYHIGI